MRVADRLAHTLRATVLTCAGAGVVAAGVGGPLTRLGDGYGGLLGLPTLVLTLLVLVVAPTAAVQRRRTDDRWIALVVVTVGTWLAYGLLAHLLDPCALGLLDLSDTVGQQPWCERFGAEVSIHTRFHLLLHAATAVSFIATADLLAPGWSRGGRRAADAAVGSDERGGGGDR